MGDMGEFFQIYKENHEKRVAKTPDRVSYAIDKLKQHNIKYVLRDGSIGYFQCHRKADDKIIQFWAGTGKIYGYDIRGINNLIKLCESKKHK